MSTLILVRHGQAAAFETDSDRLTELGKAQASKLGEYFVQQRMEFDEVVSGGLRRHRETLEAVVERYREARLLFPEARVVPGWNEYDATGIIETLSPRLADKDAAYAALTEAFKAAKGDRQVRNRHFQRMFEVVMARWIAGDLTDPSVETFASFHSRAAKAFDSILDDHSSRRVVVFTSGGPIGVSVARALSAPPPVALELNWRVRNASLTEFLFSKGRASLDTFNHIPHLNDPALRSFR